MSQRCENYGFDKTRSDGLTVIEIDTFIKIKEQKILK